MRLLNDDSCIEDKDDILGEVSRFYRELFHSVGDNAEVLEARRKLLQHTSAQVIEEQREEIKQKPNVEELRKTLLSLPKGKLPGLDGMTMKVLLATWSFIQADCLVLVKHSWDTGVLPHSTMTRVMKAIPKKADKRRLRD